MRTRRHSPSFGQKRSMSIDGSGGKDSEGSRGGPDGGFLGVLRAVALVAVVAGAGGSLALMFRAGHRNDSRFLLMLFAIWVLSPFVALSWANAASKRWSVLARAALYCVMLILTAVSLAAYLHVFTSPPASKPAFVFLVVPLGSWLLMAIVVAIVAFISGRRPRRDAGD
jgi:membrane-associated protease RseP (regulator of RpoE activity)